MLAAKHRAKQLREQGCSQAPYAAMASSIACMAARALLCLLQRNMVLQHHHHNADATSTHQHRGRSSRVHAHLHMAPRPPLPLLRSQRKQQVGAHAAALRHSRFPPLHFTGLAHK